MAVAARSRTFTGQIRDMHFGEGAYAETEAKIRGLLQEAGAEDLPPLTGASQGEGAQAAADGADAHSPETYMGYRRAEHFASAGAVVRDQPMNYQIPNTLQINQWALGGLIDGHPPGADHGVDTAPDGTGVVREQRLYQLIRQSGSVTEHTFSIEFLDPKVDAYSFTFG
jgi:hypothetical protein